MLRKGMWVVDDQGKVGLVAGFVDGKAEFHHVDDKGLTTLVVVVTQDKLRQAKQSEIPKARLDPEAFPPAKLAAMGYAP